MEENREQDVNFAAPGKGRKRIKDKSSWKREKAKIERHKPIQLPRLPKCEHGNKKQGYLCDELTIQDISRFHRHFYESCDKIKQDTFLLKYCSAKTPNKKGSNNKRKQTITYLIPKVELTEQGRKVKLIKVCQKYMITVLGISKDRIQRICKQNLTSMSLPKENRGGDRRSSKYAGCTESVQMFIKDFKSVESHYTRGRSKVQYLSSDLSIRKLWRTYNNTHEKSVKYEFFRRIFTTKFNLSFKTPATDTCSKCAEMKELIKYEMVQSRKIILMAQLRVHKLRAKWFYKYLGLQKNNEITFTFDCQKNLPVPKLPDQATYYSRQLYVYNFTICQGSSHAKQTPSNTFMYTWLESEAPKGANQIASAVYHRLRNTEYPEIVNHIRLMCDGCGGQNKNTILIGMLAYWLKVKAPNHIQKISVIFPIVGHSFLPPDRIFGKIERQIRKNEIILVPNEYFEHFAVYGTVLRLGNDFQCYDWKQSVKLTLKPPGSWHFGFKQTKLFTIMKDSNGRNVVRGESQYVSQNSNYGSIVKKNKTLINMNPRRIDIGHPVNTAKLKDVRTLLTKHFGEQWQNHEFLQFFVALLNQDPVVEPLRADDETDNESTLMEESEDIRV